MHKFTNEIFCLNFSYFLFWFNPFEGPFPRKPTINQAAARSWPPFDFSALCQLRPGYAGSTTSQPSIGYHIFQAVPSFLDLQGIGPTWMILGMTLKIMWCVVWRFNVLTCLIKIMVKVQSQALKSQYMTISNPRQPLASEPKNKIQQCAWTSLFNNATGFSELRIVDTRPVHFTGGPWHRLTSTTSRLRHQNCISSVWALNYILSHSAQEIRKTEASPAFASIMNRHPRQTENLFLRPFHSPPIRPAVAGGPIWSPRPSARDAGPAGWGAA